MYKRQRASHASQETDVPRLLLIVYYLADYTTVDRELDKPPAVQQSSAMKCCNLLAPHTASATQNGQGSIALPFSLPGILLKEREAVTSLHSLVPGYTAPALTTAACLRALLLPGFSWQLALPGAAQRLQRAWQEHTNNCSRGSKAAGDGDKIALKRFLCRDFGVQLKDAKRKQYYFKQQAGEMVPGHHWD